MSEDPIERIFMERATLREIGADMSNYRPTQTGYEPASPVPESLPILGGNEMQGYPAEEADTAERTMEFNPSDGLVGSMQMLSEGFGAGIQQYKINEVEKRIADKTLTPLNHIQAVVENPDVPLGDYYDASTNTFSNVPSDDYILHQGQLYPRKISIDKLTEHHLNNLANDTAFENTDELGVRDGVISTIRTLTFEQDGKTYVVPTVFDGKILDNDDAIARAMRDGVYEVFNTLEEAEDFDRKIHQDNAILNGEMRPIGQEEATAILQSLDLSEDNMLINYGRMLIDTMLDPMEGLGVGARATAQLIRGGAPDPNTLGSGIVPGATTGARTADDVSDIGFYSEVTRAVDALPMDKGSASQMRAMIAKTPGVKAEEMAWIGLDDFLKGKKSVTKAEVQEYVQANQVQIQEVVKGDLDTANIRVELIDGEHHLINDEGEIIDTYPGDAQGALDAVNAIPPNTNRPLSDTKFASYTLPGGENYREVLLTLPTKTGAATNAARYDELNNIAARRNLTDAESDEMVAIEQAEFSGESGRAGEDFASGHFDEKNVLAHMRLNDRTGPNGERILFIEEIQSDWHQMGRNKGYQKSEEVTQESAKEFFGITDDDWSQMTPDTRQSYVDEINEGGQHIEQGKRGQVPDAPLKKTWHEMAFRRVARMAAEEGYDAIAWTPGKMQAERYNLSKQIDELRYRQNDDGTFDIVPVRNGDTIQAEEFEGVSKDRLSDVVGKEVAEKMAKGEGESDPGTNAQTLRGVDLEVGGAGMKGFYDQMLKTYAAKWGKKFGAKVGVSPINADGPASVLEAVETPSGEFVVMDRVNGGQLANFETQQAADNFIKNEMADTEVWTLPVTKKMRDSIMSKGIPTFAVGGAVALSKVERDQNEN
jgi:hypothetical protein